MTRDGRGAGALRPWVLVLRSSLLAFLAAGCGAPQAKLGGIDPALISSPEGHPIKITCVRFGDDARTRKQKIDYYVMLSRGWKLRYGAWAREPFEKVFKHPFKGVEVPDIRMAELYGAMKNAGWDRLPGFDLDRIDVVRLGQLERDVKANPALAVQTRFLTVQVGDEKKTVAYSDALRLGGDVHQAFVACEIVALKGAMQHTVQITVDTMPLPFK